MSTREQLMAQQRARAAAARARKLAAKKAAEAKKKLVSKASKTDGPVKDPDKYSKVLDKNIGPVADGKVYGKNLKAKKNPFSGLSNAEIKAKYKGMSQADKKKFGIQMHTAAMANRKKGGAKAVSTNVQPSTSTKSAGTKPVNKVPQRFADGAKGGKYDKAVKNKETAKQNFFRSSSGTRGENVRSNPKLKSQPTKPKRSSFPAGRSGSREYAAAMAKYRKSLTRPPKVRRMTNRRGRAI